MGFLVACRWILATPITESQMVRKMKLGLYRALQAVMATSKLEPPQSMIIIRCHRVLVQGVAFTKTLQHSGCRPMGLQLRDSGLQRLAIVQNRDTSVFAKNLSTAASLQASCVRFSLGSILTWRHGLPSSQPTIEGIEFPLTSGQMLHPQVSPHLHSR